MPQTDPETVQTVINRFLGAHDIIIWNSLQLILYFMDFRADEEYNSESSQLTIPFRGLHYPGSRGLSPIDAINPPDKPMQQVEGFLLFIWPNSKNDPG